MIYLCTRKNQKIVWAHPRKIGFIGHSVTEPVPNRTSGITLDPDKCAHMYIYIYIYYLPKISIIVICCRYLPYYNIMYLCSRVILYRRHHIQYNIVVPTRAGFRLNGFNAHIHIYLCIDLYIYVYVL